MSAFTSGKTTLGVFSIGKAGPQGTEMAGTSQDKPGHDELRGFASK